MTIIQPIRRQPRGLFEPSIDIGRCEGMGKCIAVCPEDVFGLLPIEPEDRASLTPLQKLKLFALGGKVAYALSANRCRACGLCVEACPGRAIALQRAVAAADHHRASPRDGEKNIESMGE